MLEPASGTAALFFTSRLPKGLSDLVDNPSGSRLLPLCFNAFKCKIILLRSKLSPVLL